MCIRCASVCHYSVCVCVCARSVSAAGADRDAHIVHRLFSGGHLFAL